MGAEQMIMLGDYVSSSGSASPVSGYTAWYNPTTIAQTAGVVTAWNDASANAYNFTTAHASPVYVSSGINGLASIQFNGTSQFVSNAVALSSYIDSGGAAYTIYIVYQVTTYTGGSNTQVGFFGSVLADTTTDFGQGEGTTHLVAGHVDSGGSKVVDAGAISTGITIITEQYYDGTNIHFRVNGTDQATTAASSVSSVSGTMHAGVGNSGNNFFHGLISEIIVYNTALSSGNRTTNRSYLGTKYAGTG